MEIGKSNWQPVAGLHCFPPHDYPPDTLCSGELCEAWMETHNVPKSCGNEHSHSDHYWDSWEARGTGVFRCPGRQYCDPRFLEPS